MTILIVDDQDLPLLERAFLAASPKRRVLGCTGAASALDRLEQLSTERLSDLLIVTDLKMPGLDGTNFIATIRHRWSPGPVIIALSTSSYRKDIDAVFEAGANAYHEKPMGYHDTVELCSRITAYWDGSERPLMRRNT